MTDRRWHGRHPAQAVGDDRCRADRDRAAPCPRARQVTACPAATAWPASSRPSQAVPPRIRMSIRRRCGPPVRPARGGRARHSCCPTRSAATGPLPVARGSAASRPRGRVAAAPGLRPLLAGQRAQLPAPPGGRNSPWSRRCRYGGDTSTTSIATSGVSSAIDRTARSAGFIPPGSGVRQRGEARIQHVDVDRERHSQSQPSPAGRRRRRSPGASRDPRRRASDARSSPARRIHQRQRPRPSNRATRPGRSCARGSRPDSISLRIGVPCECRLPRCCAVSAVPGSKCSSPTLPQVHFAATAVADG